MTLTDCVSRGTGLQGATFDSISNLPADTAFIALEEEFMSVKMFPDILEPSEFTMTNAATSGCPLAVSYPYKPPGENMNL